MLDLALQHFQAGRFAEAASCCGKILNQTPRDFPALHLLGRIRLGEGQFDEAAYFLTAALGVGSSNTDDVVAALNDLAKVQLAQRNHDAATEHCRRALALRPHDAAALQTLGSILYENKRFDEAIDVYREGLAVQPNSAGLHNNLGNALRAGGKLEEAAAAYRIAIALQPKHAQPHSNLGNVLCLLDQPDDALKSLRRAIEIDPNNEDTLIGLANAHRMLKQYDEACEHYRRLLPTRPNDLTTLFGLGVSLLALSRHADAVEVLQRAKALYPSYTDTLSALANALHAASRYVEASREYEAARKASPDSAELRLNQAILLLTIGEWAEGWRGMEARFGIPSEFPPLKIPAGVTRWRGESGIEGKSILLLSEQGFGDTIMLVRYVRLVAERGARVILRVQIRLGKLLADMPGADRVLTEYDEPPITDLVCPLMSLPLAFGTEVATVPATVPYIRTPPHYRLLWQTLLGPRTRPRIGIAWRGQQHRPERSMPLARLEPLLRRTEFEFHGLQLEFSDADRDWLAENPLLIDHSEEQKDFCDTAAIADEMDLVISIDTSVAHVAGALGRPLWIMLPHNADYRWMLDREDTPWYPTARLFRQQRARDWEGVVADVVNALDGLR